jgi:hypothetical protein
MTSPTNAVTLEDERYYEWPGMPGVHFPSITTVIKQGVPKPNLTKWAVRRAAEEALNSLDVLIELRRRADAHG